MAKQYDTITGVTNADLDSGRYSPDEYDAIQQPDGTYNLVPLLWTTQQEFMEYAFGTGNEY